MSKRIIINYNKLGQPIKKAISEKFPNGIEEQLSRMKHVVKGYFFDGFVFEHEDVTYLIEWEILTEDSSAKFIDTALEDDELMKENFDESDLE